MWLAVILFVIVFIYVIYLIQKNIQDSSKTDSIDMSQHYMNENRDINMNDYMKTQEKEEKASTRNEDEDGIFVEYEFKGKNSSQSSMGEQIKYSQDKNSPYDRFRQMRRISAENDYSVYYNNFYNNSRVSTFVRQAEFMKDFTDNYQGFSQFNTYYPTYGSMDNLQLRTYFTWRTRVRQGIVEKTSLSYVFVYIYELINNIGVTNPIDGLEKLVYIWKMYSAFDNSLDKYLITWLKDYYICNDFEMSFRELVSQYKLEEFYRELFLDVKTETMSYESASMSTDYKFADSKFYSEEREKVIAICYEKTMKNLSVLFDMYGLTLNKSFMSTQNQIYWWELFGGALYEKQQYKKTEVKISDREQYYYNGRSWEKRFVEADYKALFMLNGYIIKRIEANLRVLTGHPHRLNPKKTSFMERLIHSYNSNDNALAMLKDELFDDIIDRTSKSVVLGEECDIVSELTVLLNSSPYAELKNMRKEQSVRGITDREKKFFLQGKIIAELTDCFKEHIPISGAIPVYADLTNNQLRCYISWRTDLRNGKYRNIEPEYINMYISELVNNIGTTDKYDVISKLTDTLNNLASENKTLQNTIIDAIKSYYVYNDFKEPFYDIANKFGITKYYPNVAIEYGNINDIKLFSRISTYKIEKSKFYTEKTQSIVSGCFEEVMKAVTAYFADKGVDLRNLESTNRYETNWCRLFKNTIHYDCGNMGSKTISIASNESYTFKKGILKCGTLPQKSTVIPTLMGFIIKRTESGIRRITKYKYKLTADASMVYGGDSNERYVKFNEAVKAPQFAQVIDNSVKRFFEIKYPRVFSNPESVFEKPFVFEFDVSKLSKIRSDADVTREKLTIEEELVITEVQEIKHDNIKSPNGDIENIALPENDGDCWSLLIKSLSAVQKSLIKAILDDDLDKLKDIALNGGTMIEILVEEINEKAIDADNINDIIIESDDGKFYICDDYDEDIRSTMGRMK